MNKISIQEAIDKIQNGKSIIVIDDTEDSENEGDLICAAHFATPLILNELQQISNSDIQVAITQKQSRVLGLSSQFLHKPLTQKHITLNDTASSDITSLSKSIQQLIQNKYPQEKIMILEARHMGVLKRAGHTEASIDLARLAGFEAVGLLSKCRHQNGTPLKQDELIQLAEKNGLSIITIQDLIQYRNQTETYIKHISTTPIKTRYGTFNKHCYEDTLNNKYHYALSLGDPYPNDKAITVRVHSECLTGDIFGSLRCDCGPQLNAALEHIQNENEGVVLYMRQEGRGIGLNNKVKAYKLQETGMDTVEANLKLGFNADLRDYGVGAQILLDLGIRKIKLLTNNPRKVIGLKGYNIDIVERLPLKVAASNHNQTYLQTKKDKLGHYLN